MKIRDDQGYKSNDWVLIGTMLHMQGTTTSTKRHTKFNGQNLRILGTSWMVAKVTKSPLAARAVSDAEVAWKFTKR